jgi:voltage-gated potassium channel
MRRFAVAIGLMLGVLLYGTLGHFFLLYPQFSLLQCAARTIVLLASINEAFFPTDLGVHYDTQYVLFMLSLVVFGMGVVVYALSAVTASLVEGDLRQLWRLRRMNREIQALRNHIIVAGGGETGHYIAKELRDSHHPFVIIERDAERLDRLRADGMLYIDGDASEETVLEAAGISRALGMSIAMPTDKETLFVTITARQMNPKLRIIAKGVEPSAEKKLVAAGADKVVLPAFIGGMRMASELVRPVAVTFLDRMLRDPADHTRFEELIIKAHGSLHGQTLESSNFEHSTGLHVVAIRRPDDARFDYRPKDNEALQAGTALVVIGRTEDVAQARHLAGD